MGDHALKQDYDRMSAFYDEERGQGFFRNNLRLLRELLDGYRDRVLEIGCGTGAYIRELRADGYNVLGVDFSGEMCAAARRKLCGPGDDPDRIIRCADAEESLGFDGTFRAITVMDCWENFPQPHRVIENAHAALDDDGRLIIFTANPLAGPVITLLEKTGFKKLKPAFVYYNSFRGRTVGITRPWFRLERHITAYYGMEYVFVFSKKKADPAALMDRSARMAYEEYEKEPMREYYGRPVLGLPSRHRVKQVVKALGGLEGKTVLDIGCEEGYVSRRLAAEGARVTGIDICAPALWAFREKCRCAQACRPALMRAQNLGFKDASFDAAVCTEAVEHMPSLDRVFSEAWRVLKPGALFAVTFPNEGLRRLCYPLLKLCGINTDAEKDVTIFEYTRQQIESALGGKFDVVRTRRVPWYLPVTTLVVCRKREGQ